MAVGFENLPRRYIRDLFQKSLPVAGVLLVLQVSLAAENTLATLLFTLGYLALNVLVSFFLMRFVTEKIKWISETLRTVVNSVILAVAAIWTGSAVIWLLHVPHIFRLALEWAGSWPTFFSHLLGLCVSSAVALYHMGYSLQESTLPIGILMAFGFLVYRLVYQWTDAVRQRDEVREQLHAQELKRGLALERVLTTMVDGIIVADAHGKFIHWNPAAEAIIGIGGVAEKPETWVDTYGIFHPDGKTKFKTEELPLLRALKGEEVDSVDMLVRNSERPQGAFIVARARPLIEEEKIIGAVVLFRDVTVLRKATQDLGEVREQLFQAGRFAAIGEIAGTIAHEINTPLGSISLASERLQRIVGQASKQNEQKMLTESILATVHRISRITSALKSLGRKKSGDNFERVDLNDVMKTGVLLCGEKYRFDGIDLNTEESASNVQVMGDEALLVQVILNILINARDSILERPTNGREVDVRLGLEGSKILLDVEDNGPGIPSDKAKQIFEPYFTTKEKGRGSGMGLALAKQIVSLHDGDLTLLRSQPGSTVFRISLPRAPADLY